LEGKKDSLSVNYLFKVAGKFYNVDEYDEYLNLSRRLYQLSLIKRDSSNIAKSLNYIGDYYYSSFKNDSAYYYYTKAEVGYKEIKHLELINRISFNKDNIILYEKNFSKLESNIIKVLTGEI